MRSATHALSRRLATSEYPTLSTKYYIYELLWNSRFELNDEWPFVRVAFCPDPGTRLYSTLGISYNFNKFRHNFVIFETNQPRTSVY